MSVKFNYPSWWTDAHSSAWQRIREAVRRDWEQTKRDLDVRRGPSLDQSVGDTLRQAAGKEPIPPDNRPNPHLEQWEDVEAPYGYGYGAHRQYGREHPEWSAELEDMLRTEWESDKAAARQAWSKAKGWVRRGYEHAHRN